MNLLNICNNASVAQWIRHRPPKPGIAGSSPAGGLIFCLTIFMFMDVLFVWFDSLRPINNLSVTQWRVFLVELVLS